MNIPSSPIQFVDPRAEITASKRFTRAGSRPREPRNDRFGASRTQATARTPQLPQAKTPAPVATTRAADPATWLGACITGEGEMSAFGLPGVTGVLVLEVPAESLLAKAGLQKNDVILSVNGAKTADTAALLKHAPALPANNSLKLGISRDQKEIVIETVP
jgi:membrane-associated protease RseP (regulator of RpoE activity)